jgi:hypothetical protein
VIELGHIGDPVLVRYETRGVIAVGHPVPCDSFAPVGPIRVVVLVMCHDTDATTETDDGEPRTEDRRPKKHRSFWYLKASPRAIFSGPEDRCAAGRERTEVGDLESVLEADKVVVPDECDLFRSRLRIRNDVDRSDVVHDVERRNRREQVDNLCDDVVEVDVCQRGV